MEAGKHMPQGRALIPALAEIYPQLYLRPGTESAAEYANIVQCGQDATAHSLAHFLGHERDSCVTEDTPAGTVPVITLHQRADFELFLQIMAHRCQQKPIPKTQGAAILDGVINWTKIRSRKEEFLRAGGDPAGWEEEFSRFTADKSNYRDALIVLSAGPYSAVSAAQAGIPEADWLAYSHTIRKAHECTHFICRRLFPDKKDAVWDELVADAVGIYAACGKYDRALAECFLGVEASGYTGGRLENYLNGEGNRQERLDALARKVHETLCRFERLCTAWGAISPYELAVRLEEEIECWKQP